MSATVRAGALEGFEELARELGVAPRPLLRRHGIAPDALARPEDLIPLDAAARVMEDAAAAAGCPDLGLRLGARQGPSVLGPLAIAMQNARTVEEAMADASRYLFVHSPAYEATVEDPSPLDPAWCALRLDVHLDGRGPRRQLVEGIVGSARTLLRTVTGGRFELRAAWLPHAPVAPEDTYRAHLGCPVSFSAPFAGLHARREEFGLDLVAATPVLREMALEHLARHAPGPTATLADQVRHALRRTLGAGRGSRTEIAALLIVHPRTLQRGLAREGTTFEALRVEVYADALARYLRDTDVPIGQLPGALGYADQAALTRACRRWLATTPARFRRAAGDVRGQASSPDTSTSTSPGNRASRSSERSEM